jgi:hypothetical protein
MLRIKRQKHQKRQLQRLTLLRQKLPLSDINNSMLLREFLYFNDAVNDFAVDRRYDNSKDSSVVKINDTRKVRLTLGQINQLRLQAEAHEAERQSELGFIKQMYGTPVEQEE